MSDKSLIFGTMPIGNLEDCTYNLIKNIEAADLIAVESERVIYKLISHYKLSVNAEIISMSPENLLKKAYDTIIEYIVLGKKVLCLSDEGSSIITDPFNFLRRLADSLKINYKVLPGPSSLISAISYSKFYEGDSFSFYGMVFYDPDKNNIYKEIASNRYPSIIFYHHEIQEQFFNELKQYINGNKIVTLASNLTSSEEIILEGELDEIINFVNNNYVKQPTLVISGSK